MKANQYGQMASAGVQLYADAQTVLVKPIDTLTAGAEAAEKLSSALGKAVHKIGGAVDIDRAVAVIDDVLSGVAPLLTAFTYVGALYAVAMPAALALSEGQDPCPRFIPAEGSGPGNQVLPCDLIRAGQLPKAPHFWWQEKIDEVLKQTGRQPLLKGCYDLRDRSYPITLALDDEVLALATTYAPSEAGTLALRVHREIARRRNTFDGGLTLLPLWGQLVSQVEEAVIDMRGDTVFGGGNAWSRLARELVVTNDNARPMSARGKGHTLSDDCLAKFAQLGAVWRQMTDGWRKTRDSPYLRKGARTSPRIQVAAKVGLVTRRRLL